MAATAVTTAIRLARYVHPMQTPVEPLVTERTTASANRTDVRLHGSVESEADRKNRGAFYTPAAITTFLVDWAIRTKRDRVLEPSTGDGAFLIAAATRLRALGGTSLRGQLFGVELSEAEANKARNLVPDADVRTDSFFELGLGELPVVDAVVGNPPYIRYHGFSGVARAKGLARASEQGVDLSGLASSWAHFVVHAASFLPEANGRLGLVLPAELMHTEYAAPVRAFLLRRFRSVTVVAFDRAAFVSAQVDAVLLLASDDGPDGLRVIRLPDAAALPEMTIGTTIARADRDRWTIAMDEAGATGYADLAASSRFTRLGNLASVDIGLVTGANAFFVLTDARVAALALPELALTPIVERPSDLGGLLASNTEANHLLNLAGKSGLDTQPAIAAYLAAGETSEINQGYKCRHRTPWYAVPISRSPADAFLPYMSHRAPRVIANPTGAYSTNLIHAVRLTEKAPSAIALAAASLSAATALSAEIEGRAYGGGVLKLETKEAERLLVPALEADEDRRLRRIANTLDRLIRAGEMEAASRRVDDLLGIDHDRLTAATEGLRSRRLGLRGNQTKQLPSVGHDTGTSERARRAGKK
jgi:adenine-specific DNA-methyltransferase